MDDDAAASDRVGIVGLGRLGLCQALTLERAGYDVLGCDVFPAYVDSINNKTLQSDEPGVVSLLRASTKLRATLSLEAVVDHSDLLMVVVATPTGIGEHAYDCGTLSRVLEDIGKLGRRDKHVVICCTVLPGYISQVASALLEGCEGCTISYNPEFIAQGDVMAGAAMRLLRATNTTPVCLALEPHAAVLRALRSQDSRSPTSCSSARAARLQATGCRPCTRGPAPTRLASAACRRPRRRSPSWRSTASSPPRSPSPT